MFSEGMFISHSGLELKRKIDLDDLTGIDYECLARATAEVIQFSAVFGIPKGGTKFAAALRHHCTPNSVKVLIVDDVLTTGTSMEAEKSRLQLTDDQAVGVVIIARGECPSWVICHMRANDHFWGIPHQASLEVFHNKSLNDRLENLPLSKPVSEDR